MKEYIARFGHGSAKLASQAQSKEKTMAKMVAGGTHYTRPLHHMTRCLPAPPAGLTERVVSDQEVVFRFPECGKLPPPVLQFIDASFGYPGQRILFKARQEK
jgi:ATP-binding cassette subfamily F protein 2